MKHQVCSMKELAEQYCKQLPRPKVEANILAGLVTIGFESVVAHRDGLNTTIENVYFMCSTEYNNENKEECKNRLLNEFIANVSYQAEELAKRALIQSLMIDLNKKLIEVENEQLFKL